MEGAVGDRIIARGRRVGSNGATGVITEVLGSDRARYFRVRWSDGHESIVFPGSDATIEPAGIERPARLSARVDLRIEEDDHRCAATATMLTERGVFQGTGEARRRPGDPSVPMIGEELAVARCLRELADRLEAAADEAIAGHESRDVHLVR